MLESNGADVLFRSPDRSTTSSFSWAKVITWNWDECPPPFEGKGAKQCNHLTFTSWYGGLERLLRRSQRERRCWRWGRSKALLARASSLVLARFFSELFKPIKHNIPAKGVDDRTALLVVSFGMMKSVNAVIDFLFLEREKKLWIGKK